MNTLLGLLLFGLPTGCLVFGIHMGLRSGKSTVGKIFFSLLWSAGLLAALAAVVFGACVCMLNV